MTRDGSNARKRAARALAAAQEIPYTEAVRRIDRDVAGEPPTDAGVAVGRSTTRTATVTGPRVTRPVPILTTGVVLIGHTSPVGSVTFHPDGRTLVSGADVTVRLWDLASRQTTTVLTAEAFVATTALSPDGQTLAVAGPEGPTILLWSIETGRIATLEGSTGGTRALVFSPDGQTLASSEELPPRPDGRRSAGQQVRLWDRATGEAITVLPRPDGYGHGLAFHPDGDILAGSGGMDGTGQLLQRSTGRTTVLTGHSAGIEVMAFSPDGRLLATGSVDSTVRLWDVSTGQTSTALTPNGGYVVAVCFSPDGATLATAGTDSIVRLWDVATGQNTVGLFGHTAFVATLAFSPDGATLASGSHDRTVRVWTLP